MFTDVFEGFCYLVGCVRYLHVYEFQIDVVSLKTKVEVNCLSVKWYMCKMDTHLCPTFTDLRSISTLNT